MMTDPYGEFEDSDEMEENDEDIGALGSILSWDDEDEAAASSAEALDESNKMSSLAAQPPSYASYPQQISIIAMQGTTQAIQAQIAQQPYQMMMQNVQGYQPQQQAFGHQNGQIQQSATMPSGQAQNQQQNSQQLHTYAVPTPPLQQQMMQVQQVGNSVQSQNQGQQSQQQQQIHVQMNQQQPTQAQQQAMSAGRQMLSSSSHPAQFAQMYQPQLYTNATPDQMSMQSMSMVQGQTQHSHDPNAFLRQMQMQYQQVPGSVSRTMQQAPIMMQQQQQQNQMVVPAAAPASIPQPTTRPPMKRKAVDVKPPAAPKSNVVSCSDTDGETRTSSESSKKVKKISLTFSQSNEDFEAEMANMTPAEKAKANRDRNREHARNTRLRKKAYLEQLKMTVDELCLERDTLVSERAGASTILVEMHNTRTEVLMSFFALRSVYEKQRELWASILDESCFACVMPVTPYRSFPASEVQVSKCQRTVLGIDGMMADTASLHVLLNNLVDRSRYPTASLQFRYTLVTEDAVVAGNQMMARWVMSTINATQLGARMEVTKQGMLCCKFNSAHKIIGLELMFDVMAFMLQLKQATGSHEFAVVPNTVQTCQRVFKQPMVMTLAEPPYTIVQVNKLWEEMTGLKAENVVGKASCRILQGQETKRKSVEDLMSEVRYKRAASAVLVNYTNQGKMFRNFMNTYPLSTDSKITHFVALTVHAEPIDSVVDHASIATEQMAPPPAPISVNNVLPPVSTLKPAVQMMQIRAAQPLHTSNQVMMQSQQSHPASGMSLPMSGGAHLVFYQPQPGILPKPANGASVLQTMPGGGAVITPRNTQTSENAPHPRNP